ncbi:nitrilase-related carbon-nitrogen hydrolase [Arthrobacter globiformis]|uniref:nitrilase-related carbon-nitrogen hydrolase n=1 Tax=Arthrobacter globiformis TaxID=1665 RepID=UPI0027913455|nr:nitrilase-related carbon-nitrogen hydrolase [Arthrobacter globiformis]MDQ0617304.1 putative amidohydrolase [Arthrobacter globiformis]
MATSTSFINFGAFTAFTLVNASVVFRYVRRRRAGEQLNAVFYIAVPAVGAIVCAYLLSQLDSNAITLGLSWLALGIVVLALITRGFRAAPPEMTTTEKATVERAAYGGGALGSVLDAQGMERTGVRIALGQLESGTDAGANLAAIDRFAATAPRWWPSRSTPRTGRRPWTPRSLRWPSRWTAPVCRQLSATAARHGITLVAGVVETAEEEARAYNTLVAFGPDGSRLAVYRKIHLFDAQGFGESRFIKPGLSTEPVVFEAGGARFGLMTCYDLRFPELARSLADAGAQVLLVCSSWVPGTHKTEQWLALNAARAIDNSVYVAGVCQAPPVSVGRSLLVDPMGYVEADLGLEPGVWSVEVSLGTVARVKEQFPMFRQRRLL